MASAALSGLGCMWSSQLRAWAHDPLSKQRLQKRFLSSWALRDVLLGRISCQTKSLSWKAGEKKKKPKKTPKKPRRGPFPLHPGPDIRNWLRKYYNGYQIFGNCLSFSELNICLVQAASTVTTWPYGSLRVADFSFFFLLLEKTRKLLPDNTWCKCKIMLWNDCKHAVFQMFDETVKKQHKEGSTVSVRDSAGFHMKKNPKPQRSDLINSGDSVQLSSYLGFRNKTQGSSVICQISLHP